MKFRSRYFALIAAGFAMALGLAGCGSGGSSAGRTAEGTARATFLMASSDANASLLAADATPIVLAKDGGHGGHGNGGGPVDVADILSLTVTVTQIYMQYCDEDHGDDDVIEIEVGDSEFDPTSLCIEKGDTVRWKWITDAPHTITSGAPGDPDAGELFDEEGSGEGTIVELMFADEGTYPYFSDTETDVEAGMAGVINVKDDDDDEEGEHGHGHDDRSGGHDDGDDDGEDGEHGEGGEFFGILAAPVEVDLMDLTTLAQVLTTAELPAARYCKIRLHIENPRLVLVDDPETVITDVQLTANGRLFVKDDFEIEEGKDVIITIDFGGIHLVRAGNSGKYVLTPQLRVHINVTDANVQLEGEIVSVDAVNQTIDVQTDGGIVTVNILGGTSITTDDDADEADGSTATVALLFEDLAPGQEVEIEGLLTVGGSVDAGSVEVDDEDIDTTI